MFDPKTYDKSFLQANMACLKNEIDDLETWSVNNGDRAIELIQELRKDFDAIAFNLGE